MRLLFRLLDVTLLRIKLVLFGLGMRVRLGLSDFERIKHHKGFVMEKQAIKELMYGGLKEIMSNSRYYYKSSIGKEYSSFTSTGKEVVQEFITELAGHIVEAENAELDQRAKDMVMRELKGE